MKILVNLKDPDGFSDAVDDAVRASLAAIPGLSSEEREALVDARRDRAWDSLRKFVQYREYLRVEFDTEAGTATVLEEDA